MNPSSAQHAALRLLLEEVDPLLQRAEEVTKLLTQVREELSTDLTSLGSLVQQSLDAQPLLLETGRRLNTSAARIESAMQGAGLPDATAQTSGKRPSLWMGCAISAALSASVVSAAIWSGTRDIVEEARVGRALLQVWPSWTPRPAPKCMHSSAGPEEIGQGEAGCAGPALSSAVENIVPFGHRPPARAFSFWLRRCRPSGRAAGALPSLIQSFRPWPLPRRATAVPGCTQRPLLRLARP